MGRVVVYRRGSKKKCTICTCAERTEMQFWKTLRPRPLAVVGGGGESEGFEEREEEEEGRRAEAAGAGDPNAANGTMQSFVSAVRKEVDARVGRIGNLVSEKVLAATGVVAEKIHDIAREATGECDRPSPPDDSGTATKSKYYMPPARLDYVNRLRSSDASAFAAVAEFAREFAAKDYAGDRNADGPEFVRNTLLR